MLDALKFTTQLFAVIALAAVAVATAARAEQTDLTKVDAVDDQDRLEVVETDLLDVLEGTVLAEAMFTLSESGDLAYWVTYGEADAKRVTDLIWRERSGQPGMPGRGWSARARKRPSTSRRRRCGGR